MATMNHNKNNPERMNGVAAWPNDRCKLACPRGGLALAACAVVLWAAGLSPAMAQRWFFEPSISARLTATSNSALGITTDADDLVLDVRPAFRVRGDSARLHVEGSLAVTSLTYTRDTQESGLLPEADLLARLVAVERFFFVEGAVRAFQTTVNPFGAAPGSTATDNTATAALFRLSPYIDSEIRSGLHFRARSDNAVSTEDGLAFAVAATAGRSYYYYNTLSLEQDPRPLGWRLEVERSESRYEGESLPLTVELARASVSYTPYETLVVGLSGGAERDSFSPEVGTSAIYGAHVRWRPSERTVLAADGEHRFFGDSWHVLFDHRTPFLAWSIRAARDLDTTAQSLARLPPTDNVAGLLDAILTTRFPDPVERARQVQELIARQGLPASLAGPVAIVGPRLSISNTTSATVTLLGARNSLSFSIFRAKVNDALDEGPFATGSTATNNEQVGGAIAFTHRLTPTSSLAIGMDVSRIRGLDAASSDRTTQAGVRGLLSTQVGVRTHALFGAQYRKLASNVVISGNELSAFVGLDHAF